MSENLAERKNDHSLRALVEGDAFRAQVAKALPKHLTPDRFIRIACTAMLKTPKLMDCTQASVFNALLSLSQLGLEPDGRLAHLIPYGNVCQLIVDYKGLVELAMRSGNVANIHADVVCDNDEFVYDRGQISKHSINFREKRGNVFAAYATVRFKDGTEKTEVMSRDEIEAIQKRSKAGSAGPWITDWNEMAKKTVFRRLSKWITLSPEYHDILERDFDSFSGLNQPSSKSIIPPPPLKKTAPITVEAKVEPQEEPKQQEESAEETEPPNEQEPPPAEHDEGTVDGLRSAIRDLAATHFPNENAMALWLKTLTTNEEKGYRGYDSLDSMRSFTQLKFVIGALRREIAKKKQGENDGR
jgi:recombination protein RecT